METPRWSGPRDPDPRLYDLAFQLAGSGVKRLSGPLKVQSANGPADAVYPEVWSRKHAGRLFAPLVGPLTVHENVVWLTVKAGPRVGTPARLIETAPSGIGSLVSVTATTGSGRRSRLKLRPRRGGGWVVTGIDRGPGRASPAHHRHQRSQGCSRGRVGHRPAQERASCGIGPARR